MIATHYFELFREFFITDFKLRYKHSILGFFWVVLKPLSYYAVMFIVWTSLFGNTANFASYLLIGILILNFFTEGVQFGMQSLQNKAHIILKVNFPREVVVFSSIAIAAINFLINMGIYFLFRIASQSPLVSNTWWYLFLGLFCLVTLLLGIAFFISIISIRYHDIKHLVELLLQLTFWATPIFYKIESLPQQIAQIISTLNPLVPVLLMVRAGVLPDSSIPSTLLILATVTFSCVFAFTGYVFFKRSLPKIAEFF